MPAGTNVCAAFRARGGKARYATCAGVRCLHKNERARERQVGLGENAWERKRVRG
jgi:hypothetical protein